MDILFFVGIAIICGLLGGKCSNRLKSPAVVGYLIVGLILGQSGLNLFGLKVLGKLGVFNDLALSLIAFMIGSEMLMSVLRKIGKGIAIIIFSESFGAFLLVAGGVYLLTRKLYMALIFGAMAPASAPAGTAVVLQEYRAKGPLTNALYAVVGLDDGLAIVIYAFAAALSRAFLTGEQTSIYYILKGPVIEISGALLLGGFVGISLGYFIRKVDNRNEVLAISLGAIFICTGLSNYFKFSLILTNLIAGMVSANFFVFANRRITDTFASITTPIYIVFFVIAGAHLQIRLLPSMGLIGIVYILCRIVGLVGGSFMGATIAKSEPVIRKYLGLGILSQAGVAIGLALLVTREFASLGEAGQKLSILMINTIAATTIVFEIIGPIATKIAISKSGETGKGRVKKTV